MTDVREEIGYGGKYRPRTEEERKALIEENREWLSRFVTQKDAKDAIAIAKKAVEEKPYCLTEKEAIDPMAHMAANNRWWASLTPIEQYSVRSVAAMYEWYEERLREPFKVAGFRTPGSVREHVHEPVS